VLGTYSYGIYMVHMPLMAVTGTYLARLPFPKHLGHAPLQLLITGGVSILLARLSYDWLEMPFQRLKARFE
jgi:peptidoglycan/LPS O-acetylase OafA/YrhL